MAPVNFSDLVPDSPAVKRQKTAGGFKGASYNSSQDDGDDLFDDIDSSPPAHVTQPTQILDRTGIVISSPPRASQPGSSNPAEVQVMASSPFRPPQSERKRPMGGRPNAGRLASVMAPAGTAFQLPHGVQSTASKPQMIDLDDDDGPTYKGGASDNEGANRADIKPTSFVRKDVNGHGSGDGNSKFRDIMTNSTYKPGEKKGLSMAGSVYDSRNRDQATFSTIAATAKPRTSDAMSAGYGSKRPPVQARPERARPVEDITLEQIADNSLRSKTERLQNIFTWATVLMCKNMLLLHKGNFDDASEAISRQEPVNISDDETTPTIRAAEAPQMRRQLKAPIASIQERYSSTQALKQQPLPQPQSVTTELPKRGKRLMRGRKEPSPPAIERKPIVLEIPDDSEGEAVDSGVDSEDSGEEEVQDTATEGRVLAFVNKCTAEELADLANITKDVAQSMLDQRPFPNLDSARSFSNAAPTKTGKRSNRAPIGEKIITTAVEMWQGYEAVDALVTQCEEIGKPLAEEMGKWGFDVYGAAKDGELEMVMLDDASEKDPQKDSGLGTPISASGSNNGDVGEDDIKPTRSVRKAKGVVFLQKPNMMAESLVLKDYQVVGLNWLALLYKHKLSCILADEMGLGKTCQVITFLSYLAETGRSGPHLVIVPPSTLENWLREFQNFCPNLVVQPYYGMFPVLWWRSCNSHPLHRAPLIFNRRAKRTCGHRREHTR